MSRFSLHYFQIGLFSIGETHIPDCAGVLYYGSNQFFVVLGSGFSEEGWHCPPHVAKLLDALKAMNAMFSFHLRPLSSLTPL